MKNLFLACAVILCIIFVAGPAAAQCELPASDGTACEDGNSCTLNDICTNGVCAGTAAAPGTACESDNNPCTDDFCQSFENTPTCVHPVVEDNTPCDDGTSCTANSVCISYNEGENSACTGTDFAASGTACESDNNPCTSDVCNALGTCTHDLAAPGTACGSDNNLCTSDVCDAFGTCMHEAVPPGGPCVGGTCDAAGECIPLLCEDVPMTCLWPPNHQFESVTLTVPGAASAGVKATRVMSDEPTSSVKGAGGEAKWPDARLVEADPMTVFLRSERSGLDKGKAGHFGRVYTISYSATNNFDTRCSGKVQYCVPHDQSAPGKACTCQDDGPNYNALVKNV